MLDIIIPHYKEPWDVGKKFFDMLDLQRGIDFNKIHIILVNDGFENALEEKHFLCRPYQVKQISIQHAGVSAARNAGLKAATHEWVMFCDFDDMFSHVYALYGIMDGMSNDKYDVMYSGVYTEVANRTTNISSVMNWTDIGAGFCHGRFYRREFLLNNNLWFNTKLKFDEDGEFNTIAILTAGLNRVCKITMPMPPYIWCYRSQSVTTSPGACNEQPIYHFERGKNVCEALLKYATEQDYNLGVARVLYDAYFGFNKTPLCKEMKDYKNDIADWYVEHKEAFQKASKSDLSQMVKLARAENKKSGFCEDISMDKWLRHLEEIADNKQVGSKME